MAYQTDHNVQANTHNSRAPNVSQLESGEVSPKIPLSILASLLSSCEATKNSLREKLQENPIFDGKNHSFL